MRTVNRTSAAILCAIACLAFGVPSAKAQKNQVRSRVVDAVNDSQTVRTTGNIHPLARPEFDRGPVADSQPMNRMLLLLERSTEQQTALRQLMDAQQTKSSASFHNWLTPEQFGAQFGPSDADVQAVTDWLTRQGFQVAKVAAGRNVIEFSGNVAQVRNAFQTDIHKFNAHGKEFIANTENPAIPAALAPVVKGVVSLNNYPKEAHVRSKGQYRRDKATGQLTPLFTFGVPANFALAPADFRTIYNIPAGADGTGQKIAVVGQSNINIQDIRDFRNLFGLSANDPQIIVNGPDPGLVAGDEGESDLDVEWAGAIAPNATILFVTSESTIANSLTQVAAGIDLSALYIVDNNLAPVLSESYGSCEFANGNAGNQFYNQLWEQAAAQGITVVVSAGDSGSAGCDPTANFPLVATQGLAVSGIASTAFNVSVGGTDFDSSTLPVTPPNQYWSATNGATQGSALSYIPEVTWDDSLCAFNYPTACSNVDTGGNDITAASGGPSNCATLNGGDSACTAGYPLPAFQTGGIVPSTYTTRVQPDVSFFASNGNNGVAYIVCESDTNTNGASCDLNSPFQDFDLVGGTSTSTPAFAAVMALVNQKTGQRQGNANYVLYGLAASSTNYKTGNCVASVGSTPAAGCVYNDVTKGNNSVACVTGSPNCSTSSTGFGILLSGSTPAYQAATGYDAATGLGSINVTNLLNSWSSFSRTATTTALSNPTGGTPSGTAFTATVTVTSAAGTPAGAVALIANTSSGTSAALGPFVLSNGSAPVSTNLLPPGTTSLTASYGGDATHAASTSASVPFTVSGTSGSKSAKTQVYFVGFDANNNPLTPTTGSQTVTYGTSYILLVAVSPANGSNSGLTCGFNYPATASPFPCPTGAISLTDGGQPLNDFPSGATQNATNTAKLNNLGIAEDQPIQLPATVGATSPGVHTIAAAYAGDANYAPGSASNTLSITVQKAATQTGVAAVTTGSNASIQVLVITTSNGAGPTGTVTFANGSTSIGTAACAPTSGPNNTNGTDGTSVGTAFCVATLSTTISTLYPVPFHQPKTPILPFVLLAMALVLFLGLVRWMPQHRRRAYAYTGLIAFALLATVMAGCGGGGGGGGGGTVTRTINVSYPGDGNYTASTGSTTVTIP